MDNILPNSINNAKYGSYQNIDEKSRELLPGSATSSSGNIAATIFIFIFAGLLEIGGGWLVWQGVRENNKPKIFIPIGCIILACYGFVPTLQPDGNFGRIYAVYGGFFIILSYLWGYVFDKTVPDIGDYIGALVALAGVCIAWFWPR